MPWKVDTMSDVRRDFVELASVEGSQMSELCRRFGVSRKTGYKWLKRFQSDGQAGLADRSRRPADFPGQTSAEMEARIVELRQKHPAWGGRKLRRWLSDRGVSSLPAASTIMEILKRHGLVRADNPSSSGPYQRFERERPNELWQMDFKGHFGMSDGTRCHPLTVLDDHSRFSILLQACENERGETVQRALTGVFRLYGLPEGMLMDNGSPWGDDRESPWTPLTVWLLRLGIKVSHGRPYHPQTQGKIERFHRTLKAEVLQGIAIRHLEESQARFDPWREIYNYERPHEALEMSTPGRRYEPSARSYPEHLPEQEFSAIDQVRQVQSQGKFSFHGQRWHVSKAFVGQRVGLRPTLVDGVWQVWFGRTCLGEMNLAEAGSSRRVVRRR